MLFIAYMAPEVIHGGEGRNIGRGAGNWGLGCLLVEIVTGKVKSSYCMQVLLLVVKPI